MMLEAVLGQATSPTPTAFPWNALIVQCVGSALGGALGVLVALFSISRTEWFRKSSAWEPFAGKLWEARLASYVNVTQCMVAIKVQGDKVHATAMKFTQDPAHFELMKDEWLMECEKFDAAWDKLGSLWQESRLITPSGVTTAIVDFLLAAFEYSKAAHARMEARAGMPIEYPRGTVKALSDFTPDQARMLMAATQNSVESKMAESLRLPHLDIATKLRFEDIGKGFSDKRLKELFADLQSRGINNYWSN